MTQIYCLSVFSLLCGGLVIWLLPAATETFAESRDFAIFEDAKSRICFGIFAIFITLMEIFVPFCGIVLIGDLLPVAANFALAVLMLFGRFSEAAEKLPAPLVAARDFLQKKRRIIGISIFAIGVLHFLFPQAMLL